jgi:hypothetical protein
MDGVEVAVASVLVLPVEVDEVLEAWLDLGAKAGIDRRRRAERYGDPEDARDVERVGRRGELLALASPTSLDTVPWAIANASFKRQQRNQGVTFV